MDRLIDIMLESLRARRVIATKYSDGRELEMLNAQEGLLKGVRADVVKAGVKKVKKIEKTKLKKE